MNTSTQHWAPDAQKHTTSEKIVVIGAGPVGLRFIDELRKKSLACHIVLFGNEPYAPYNRVQLSNVLSHRKDYDDILIDLPESTEHFQFDYIQQHIEKILVNEKCVITRAGERYVYDRLVIATGSKPHIPHIDGIKLPGVYTFRNLHDTEALMARLSRSRKVVVVGGGLLGLEAARALRAHNTEVTVMQQSNRLMNRQLDEVASQKLKEFIEALGIWIDTSAGVRGIVGSSRVEGVLNREGDIFECDTVVFCTGIQPQTNLALEAGIAIGRGISVNDMMETSAENIYAIGECCEHKGQVYGIVAPGLEQASVLANRIAGGNASYQGTQLISSLKVVGKPVYSMGEVAEVMRRPKQSLISYHNTKTGDYRKIVVHRGQLLGACSVGEWPENRRVQEVFLSKKNIPLWQQLYFKLTGQLWLSNVDKNVASWPETSIICQCNQISRGEISNAISTGCLSTTELGKQTGAGTVCGSCQPLLQNLFGKKEKPVKVQGGLPILVSSFIAAIAAVLFFLMPGIQPVDSVQTPSYEFLWTDGYWKQVSGFTLIGLITIGLFMSLRKRFSWDFLGNFSHWRVLHTVLGVIALGVLLAHTGAHLGENLNRWLMINFLVISAIGALAGISLWWAGKVSFDSIQALKKSWYWAHLIVVWPLPALLIIHVLSVYYF